MGYSVKIEITIQNNIWTNKRTTNAWSVSVWKKVLKRKQDNHISWKYVRHFVESIIETVTKTTFTKFGGGYLTPNHNKRPYKHMSSTNPSFFSY